MNVVLLLLMCRLGRIGSTEDFCNFAIKDWPLEKEAKVYQKFY